jgi:hypothetical protein
MADLTIAIDPDELVSLIAVAELSEQAEDPSAVLADTARAVLHEGLAARLDGLGLPWAPSPEMVRSHQEEAAEAGSSPTPGVLRRLASDLRVRKYGGCVLAVVFLVVLLGGYALDWQWTGFKANDQVWDWMHLLLLPVVFGTLPLWIQHAGYISWARRAAYLAVVVAFAAFVAAGYLAPLAWTGFSGNTLWDWFELILLPVAMISVRAWPAAGRAVRGRHKAGIAALLAGWAVTLIGGYGAHWLWTGYPGNTLWDWLQLLLLPLVFPTILLPAMLKWITGNAAERAKEDEEKAKENPPGNSSLAKA